MSSGQPSYKEYGLSRKEYEQIKNILSRKPNNLELALFGVMWSEHCSYKHSKKTLRLLPTEGKQVVVGPGENAGVVDIGDDLGIAMKVESHNHPSAVEPYQGAATGVGGIIRDIFTMGARPIGLLNSLRFGEFDQDRVPYLFNNVISGIADYGNCVGIPTVGGEVYFEGAYAGNPLVNVMCVGVVKKNEVMLGTAGQPGNIVLAAGAATGRDGIQGASFASEELGEDTEEDRPAVQVGDPFLEKLLIEATLEAFSTDAVIGIQDMGAAGLTSSSCEMAARSGVGMELDLLSLPLRDENIEPWEIMLSESQERMLIVCEEERVDEIKSVYNKWDLEAEVIGRVTDDGQLRIKKGKDTLAEVPARFLADDAPEYDPPAKRPEYLDKVENFSHHQLDLEKNKNYSNILLKLISRPNIISRSWIYEQFDHMVRNNTVLLPGSDAAVLRIKGTDKAAALAMDGNGRYCYADPREGARLSVFEAARNVVCSGACPLAVTDCLNFGSPENPEIFWQFKESVKGIGEACRELGISVISGNVSFYNESRSQAVYPTPVIGMLGVIDDVNNYTDRAFKNPGDIIVLCGKTKGHLGSSEYLKMIQEDENVYYPPSIDCEKELKLHELILDAVKSNIINSAHDCSDGGLATALSECCLSGSLGAKLDIKIDGMPPEAYLFGEDQSRIIISLNERDLDDFKMLARRYNIDLTLLGHVCSKPRLVIGNYIDLFLEEMNDKWSKNFADLPS